MPSPPSSSADAQFFSAAKLIAAWTMLSRVLGLVRESLLAATFGAGWVLDSFYLAFAVPNLFRRLFGEGALSSAFIPVFTEERERDPESAWRLAAATLTLLTAGLGLLTAVGEAGLLLLWRADPTDPENVLFCQLAMVTLAFFPFICTVAVIGGMLNVLGRFSAASLVHSLLNLCVIAAVLLPSERWLSSPTEQAEGARIYAVAWGVTAAGVAELAVMIWALRAAGGRVGLTLMLDHPGLWRTLSLMGPMILGLGVLQIMEFVNVAVVRALTAPGAEFTAADPDASTHLHLFGLTLDYPLEEGSLSVLQCGQRLYQFPLGVFATALGTAVFPLFSLYAARGDRVGLSQAVAKAIRLSLFIGLPAGAGLALSAEPVCRLLFERGRFGPDDTDRTAAVVVWYGLGMWAFCLHQIVARAYYGLQDSQTPLRVGLTLLPVNFGLNVGLVWLPGMGVSCVAVASAVTFAVSAVWMTRRLAGQLVAEGGPGLPTEQILASALRTAAATAAMAAAVAAVDRLPDWPAHTLSERLLHVVADVGVGLIVFAVGVRLLRMPELGELLRRSDANAGSAQPSEG